jgi:hypothetical protein
MQGVVGNTGQSAWGDGELISETARVGSELDERVLRRHIEQVEGLGWQYLRLADPANWSPVRDPGISRATTRCAAFQR